MLDNDNDREQSVEIVMLVHETLDLIKSALPHVTVSDPDILAKFIRILENPIEDPNDFRQMLLCASYLAKDFKGHPVVDKLYELINVSLNTFGEEIKSSFLATLASMNFQSEIGLNDPALLEDTSVYMGLSLGFGKDPLDKFPSAKMNFPFKKFMKIGFVMYLISLIMKYMNMHLLGVKLMVMQKDLKIGPKIYFLSIRTNLKSTVQCVQLILQKLPQ